MHTMRLGGLRGSRAGAQLGGLFGGLAKLAVSGWGFHDRD